MKRKLFLLLAFILGGVTGVKADGLPTPVYTQDFESATTEKGSAGSNFGIVGATLTGDGAIVTGDVFFGQYYQNRPNAETSSYRTNYLSLSTDVFGNESFSTNKAVTISFWVNPYNAISKTLTSNFAPLIVAYGTGGSEAHGYPFGLHTATGFGAHSHLDDNFYDVHGDPHPDLFTGGTSFEKSWHHVVCVYSEVANSAGGKNTQIKQYLDGALIESVARAHNNGNVDTETSTVTEMQLLNQLKEIVIGGNAPVWNDPDNLFAYDEIAIYDVALTDDQVASLYNTKEIGTYYLSTIVNDTRKWLNKNESGYTYAYDQGLPFTLLRVKGSAYNLKFGEGDYLNDVGSNWQTKIVGSKNDDWKLQAEDGGYKLLLGVNNACQLFIANTSTGLIEITHSTDNGNIWEFVDPETALKYAIEKAEEHVLGFEAGEYAPYNNTAALAALATAKAATTTDARISAYAALTSATWTANEEDVDAICNGSFTGIARGTQDNVVPGWDGVFRKLITTEDYAALSASKEGRAMFSHDKTYVYGGQTGYTMPLKRNTKYALSFKAAGWENGNIATVSAVIKKPDGSTLKTLNITPTKRINEAESLVSGSIDFTVETSGNYTLEVTVPASTLAVITDFSVERLGIPVLMQVSGVAKMGTFCAPFNVEIPSGVKAYTLSDGTSDDWVHMNEVEGTTIAAGTPVLLTSDTKVEQEFVGQMTVLEPNNDGLLKGVFEKTEVAPDANNYILQYQDSKCAFYIVSDADIYIGKNRCYLHVAKTSARIAIDREEDGFTGINEVKSSEVEAKMMKDGKYLVKGRIIVVKNGKVYGTNGQILN